MSGSSPAPSRPRSLRTVFGLLAAVSVLGIVAVGFAGERLIDAALARVEAGTVIDRTARARANLAQRAMVADHTVQEYAWWDDTWDYIDHPAGAAAAAFIRDNYVTWLPDLYGDRVIGIWDRARRPVFLWTDTSFAGVGHDLQNDALFDLIDRRQSVGGYVRTSKGLFLIGASVVRHTSDDTGLGPRNGYVILGVPADETLVATIGRELRETIHLVAADPAAGDSAISAPNATDDSLETAFGLAGLLDRRVADVHLSASREWVEELDEWSDSLLFLTVLVGGFGLLVIWMVANRTVAAPIRDVADALARMRAAGRFEPITRPPPSREWADLVDAFNQTTQALRSSENQLLQAQKMEALGTLAGGIAHDFNNLMGAVLVSAASVREDIGPAHRAVPSVETIERATRRAAELTRQLLSFSRRDRLRMAPLDLNEVVGNIARICERTFDRAIRIEQELAASSVLAIADAGQMEQALLNLCINARDAMAKGGVLSLRTRVREVDEQEAQVLRLPRSGPHVVISVIDTGTGMTAEMQRRIFEPFYTTKEHGKGTGLGLAMVYGIVSAHDGVITVTSEPGRGARFDILLAAAGGAVAATPAGADGALPRGTETVLIVDDEADLRIAVAHALRRLGYEALEAQTGRRGIEALQEHQKIALVILDLIMPDLSGTETFRALRALRPAIPVLVCSGFSSAGEVQDLLDAGANGFLAKPFEVRDLARHVRELLDAAIAGPEGPARGASGA